MCRWRNSRHRGAFDRQPRLVVHDADDGGRSIAEDDLESSGRLRREVDRDIRHVHAVEQHRLQPPRRGAAAPLGLRRISRGAVEPAQA